MVARWVHGENVASLPFTDAKLAASIGATVEELNAEPIDPIAAEIVFDALSGSAAGFVLEEQCDEKRASFLTSDGGFDAASFNAALTDTRLSLLGVLAFGPGLGLLAFVLITIHWWPTLLEKSAKFSATLGGAIGDDGPAALFLPLCILVLGAFNYGDSSTGGGGLTGSILDVGSGDISNDAPTAAAAADAAPRAKDGRALSWQELAILKQDELFLERMVQKKRGSALADDDEEGAAPFMTDEVIKDYYAKQWSAGLKALLPFLK